MPLHTILFDGGMAKDYPAPGNPSVIRAHNLIPSTASFRPFKGLVSVSNALTARCRGAISARDSSANSYIYASDASKLYEMVDQTFTDESKVGGYSTAAGDNWEFAVWEVNGKIIATNYTDAVQSMNVGGGAGGAFADMITSTNVPKAKRVGIVGPFVVLGFTNDAIDGVRASRVWWSALGDETDFDPSATTQCDFEDLATGGDVQKVVGGADYGLIFQTSTVRTMRYIGGTAIFDLLPLNYVPGTQLPGSVVAYQGHVFYIADGGFKALVGTDLVDIGDGRVDRNFWNEFDIANKANVSAAIDPRNKIVAWAYPAGSATDNLPNKMLMCKWDEGKWAEADVETQIVTTAETQGYTLDSLDNVGTDIDDATVFDASFDSEKWKGGQFKFAAFDQSNQLSYFDGANLAATIETGDQQPIPNQRWQTGRQQIFIDGGAPTISVAQRESLQDDIDYGRASAVDVNGNSRIRASGRYQRFRWSISSSVTWCHVQGMAIGYSPLGSR